VYTTQIAKSRSKAKISISSRWALVKLKKNKIKFQKVLAEVLKFLKIIIFSGKY
jgi:hypothetical protein